jgi:hypothetical protein
MAFFNFSKEPQKIYTSEDEEYKNLISRSKAKIDFLELGGYEFVWMLKVYKCAVDR